MSTLLTCQSGGRGLCQARPSSGVRGPPGVWLTLSTRKGVEKSVGCRGGHASFKRFERPKPNSGFRVRGDFGSIDDSERCVNAVPASEHRTAGTRVT
jgi:hypothetical protein